MSLPIVRPNIPQSFTRFCYQNPVQKLIPVDVHRVKNIVFSHHHLINSFNMTRILHWFHQNAISLAKCFPACIRPLYRFGFSSICPHWLVTFQKCLLPFRLLKQYCLLRIVPFSSHSDVLLSLSLLTSFITSFHSFLFYFTSFRHHCHHFCSFSRSNGFLNMYDRLIIIVCGAYLSMNGEFVVVSITDKKEEQYSKYSLYGDSYSIKDSGTWQPLPLIYLPTHTITIHKKEERI